MHLDRALLTGVSLALPLLSIAAPSAERLRAHTAELSSDAYEGRAPGTRAEEKTVNYLTEQFRSIGLQPGNPDGTFIQDVHLVGLTTTGSLSFDARGESLTPEPINDFVAGTRQLAPRVELNDSELVFVGYGVVAPEYDWDDFKGVDVTGKTVVMLVNDPPVTTPDGKLDDTIFRGRAMTYYGRWTYKYESALAHGAAACLIIHETGPAGYPFAVLSGNWGREEFDLRDSGGNSGRLAMEGWITWDFAKRLFAAAGHDLAALKAAAVRRDFRPVPLNATANVQLDVTMRDVASRNVAGLLKGSDPKIQDELIIYSAHWDHLGRDERLSGDQIYNGALDNASGIAVMLEVARNLAELPRAERPRRSILFLAVTAEEQGLLGSRYYAQNPLYPLTKTIANINIDGANIYAPTRDIEIVGSGSTTIEDIAEPIAARQGRVLLPDSQPEKGFFYRSDHFEFAKVGVPAFYPEAGREPLEGPSDLIDRRREEYTAKHYHKPSDEISPAWDFNAVAQDTQFLLDVGLALANRDERPQWKEGSEFKARREAMLRKQRPRPRHSIASCCVSSCAGCSRRYRSYWSSLRRPSS